METTEIIVPVEVQKKAEETEALAKNYDNYAITSTETYTEAGEHLKLIKAKTREFDELRKSLTKPLDESKKRIMDFFKRPVDFLSRAESSVKSAMLSWQREQERIRREEEQRLAEIQRKEAEKLRKQAERAEAKGNIDKAEELKVKSIETQTIAPVVESKVEKISGILTKKIWKFRVLDITKIPREYLIPNEKILGELARATKGKFKIEGIEFYSENVIAAGR